LVNNELKRIWKERSWANLMCSAGICLRYWKNATQIWVSTGWEGGGL
jgi:hypothetical protein